MNELVQAIFATFMTVIQGLAGGLKTAFAQILYVDPSASDPVFSPMVLFIFTLAGVGLATGILYKMFGLIKSHRRG